MTKKEVIEIINNIEDYLRKTAYNEISWTMFLKVDKFFENLKDELKEGNDDRS